MAGNGTVVVWNAADAVGRIRLDTGEELRVGQTAFAHRRPAVGMRCDVIEVEPHPLGGKRAIQVKLLEGEVVAVTPVVEAPKVDRSEWLLERIRASASQPVANVEVENLLAAHAAFTGKRAVSQIFGIDPATVPAARRPELLSAIASELEGWKERLTDPIDQLELDRAGKQLGLESLRMKDRPKLRGEPFGSTDGLDDRWRRRVEAWRAAARGERQLALSVLGFEEGAAVEFGAADTDALRERALEYELTEDSMFPRELAALLSTADGLTIGGTEVLWPVSAWQPGDDGGLELGSGSTEQGTLALEKGSGPFSAWKLVDRDDDGIVLHRFESLGAFLDALLGL